MLGTRLGTGGRGPAELRDDQAKGLQLGCGSAAQGAGLQGWPGGSGLVRSCESEGSASRGQEPAWGHLVTLSHTLDTPV